MPLDGARERVQCCLWPPLPVTAALKRGAVVESPGRVAPQPPGLFPSRSAGACRNGLRKPPAGLIFVTDNVCIGPKVTYEPTGGLRVLTQLGRRLLKFAVMHKSRRLRM
jgi:hypothetical protein